MKYDVLVVGAGFSGAAAARELADAGKQVLVLEARAQIGGNMYDSPDEEGVLIHRYGPHIFHSSDKEVWDYLNRFSRFVPYEHRVLGRIDGKLVPIPFNYRSLELLFPPEKADAVKKSLAALFPGQERVSVLDLTNASDETVRAFGQYVFEKVFLHYTAKQWGMAPERVDRTVINRVPVVLGYDDRYFHDTWQAMPAGGFTALFARLLDSPRIELRLNCDARDVLIPDEASGRMLFEGAAFAGPVIFTGAVDRFFGCRYGPLPYRSLDLRFTHMEVESFQPAAVVNYPNEEAFTRITEFKKLTGQTSRGTTLLREYPLPYDPDAARGNIPYYVIAGEESAALYRRYAALAASFPGLRLCGRLAEYRYYNMDAAVGRALRLARGLLAEG